MKSCALFTNFVRVAVAAALLTTQILPAENLRGTSAVDLLIQKAHSLEGRDRDDLAAQVWQQVLIANPNQPEALVGLARWAKRAGKNDEANAYLSRLRKVAPNSPALTQLESVDPARRSGGRLDEAAKLAANGHTDEAIRIYREVFGSTPPQGGWAVAYYETLANTATGFEPAVSALNKLAAAYPEVPAYQIAAGKLMTYRPASRQAGIALLSSISGSVGVASKAREAWRQALIWEKRNPAYLTALKTYLSRYSDSELLAASAVLQTQNARTDPGSSDSREERLGYQALKNGSLSEAEQQFNAALARNAGSERAHAGLGFVRLKTGDFDDAVRQFEAALNGPKQDLTVQNSLNSAKFWQAMRQGAKLADDGDWTQAVTRYEKAGEIRPNDGEMLRALGGALLAAGSPAKAIVYLSKAVRVKPFDESSWCALVSAKLDVEGGKSALAIMQSVPEPFAATLDHNVRWKVLRASAYADAGSDSRAREIYRQVTTEEADNLTAEDQMQLAGLALHLHDPAKALVFARKAVETAGDKPGAWEVLLPALLASGRPQEAERVYTLMPAKAQKIAMTHPAFLDTLASLAEASGDLDGARMLLERSIAMTGATASEESRIATKLHLARLLAKQGRGSEAETLVAGVTEEHPNDVEAWRTYLLILQTGGHQNEIISVAARIPLSVAASLSGAGDMVSLLARAHGAAGDPEFGAKMLEAYINRGGSTGSPDSLPQRLQLGWLLLSMPRESGRLYAVLDGLRTRTDLNDDQRKEVTNLWTTWILRSAQTARQSGNEARALGLLEQGIGMFPDSVDLKRGLSGALLASGKTRSALNVYANWGLIDAQADDYAGAIGAALAERNRQYADAWIDRALIQWPTNPKLLELAGEGARAHGDLKKAEAYWKEALNQKQSEPKYQPAASQDTTQPSLQSLLVGSDSRGSLSTETDAKSGGRLALSSTSNASAPELHLSSFHNGDALPHEDFVRLNPSLEAVSLQPALHSSYLAKAAPVAPAPVDSLEDKIAALESRNSPYLGSRMSIWNRGGESGFSRLLIEQSQFDASRMLTDSLRLSLLLQPTYLSGGTGSGSGVSLFGRQATAASFGPQAASGVAAEAQLSSQSFGVRLGTTPQGFLTHNWIGGLRVQPKGGPITILLERDSIKDTILAYAGARDPQSGQVWGGVMANTASLQGRWGDAHSGVYANGGYQAVEGRSVARNTGVNGNLGIWWTAATLPAGNLTIGMNFSAMHYERNLRYFTLGQGGYFSPQQYFLFSVPVRWTGVYGHRLQYSINGSLGAQHFVEDESDFYPADSALQARTGFRYQGLVSTGANFDFDARLNYQLAPHWILGGFASVSNARNYTASSAGLFAKYTFEERPLSFDNALPSVPDWRGQQPYLMY